MTKKKLTQDGFHVVELLIVIVVLAAIGFVGYKVLGSKANKDGKSGQNSADVKWAYNEKDNKWFVENGKAPDCKSPYTFENSPVDLSLVNVIAMPGSYRGFSYKPHGAFRADGTPSGDITVKMPTDATLVGLTRYYEGNPSTLQYLLTFETDCGIAFRFDHLYTLTPAFQKVADTTPQPKKDDTRTDPNIKFERTKFKAGDVVATKVGFPANQNIGFDFGVYDYRQPNEISKNSDWAKLHNQYQSLEWFGVCWFDMLPGADAAKANQLSLVVLNPAKPKIVSDYCTNAPYKTLDINGGQPTDG
ncbi:MAG: hypothetical protein QG553_583 [Patescibacteria group bacterium]|nr:hypothetical protein [Patescibacteria group bacterium]